MTKQSTDLFRKILFLEKSVALCRTGLMKPSCAAPNVFMYLQTFWLIAQIFPRQNPLRGACYVWSSSASLRAYSCMNFRLRCPFSSVWYCLLRHQCNVTARLNVSYIRCSVKPAWNCLQRILLLSATKSLRFPPFSRLRCSL